MALMLILVMLTGATGCKKSSDSGSGQGTGTEAAKNSAEEGLTAGPGAGRLFTDSTGRTVEIPSVITKVAVSGPLTEIIFYGFAPELLVGRSSNLSEAAAKYMPEEYLRLPVLGQLYGSRGELNLEELLAAGPDVVIDIGESKTSAAEDMEALGKQTGIPFVHITATIETMGEAFRMLGELTGLEERAEEYAQYCERIYGRTLDIMSRVGDGKVRALYCLGGAGCNVIVRGSYHAEILDLLVDNIAVTDSPSAKGTGNEADLEQILNWNPEFIIFEGDSIYETVADDETWQFVQAIAEGNYVEAPSGPYNWMGFPPSVQRYLGMIWLTKMLYPEYCDYDLEEEVKEYYKMFFHIELTKEQYNELTVNAFMKK